MTKGHPSISAVPGFLRPQCPARRSLGASERGQRLRTAWTEAKRLLQLSSRRISVWARCASHYWLIICRTIVILC
jgi:hypothetical protein